MFYFDAGNEYAPQNVQVFVLIICARMNIHGVHDQKDSFKRRKVGGEVVFIL